MNKLMGTSLLLLGAGGAMRAVRVGGHSGLAAAVSVEADARTRRTSRPARVIWKPKSPSCADAWRLELDEAARWPASAEALRAAAVAAADKAELKVRLDNIRRHYTPDDEP